jgi:metallo-beta-lactamase class B
LVGGCFSARSRILWALISLNPELVMRFLPFTLLLPLLATAQPVILLESLPANTPPDEPIHIAGNFQGWDPGDTAYILQDLGGGQTGIALTPCSELGVDPLEFKFTRGSWATVEGNATGGFLPNRVHPCLDGDTLRLSILSWEDVSAVPSTANEQVHILSDSVYMPQLDRYRRVWVYLPVDYDSSDKRYPVLYMHDGQNVFDLSTSFAGEWEVDETLTRLQQEEDDYGIIVVAIDNGGVRRFDEYSPWTHPSYGGGEGDAYLQFMVETLKPRIDSLYRTRPEREYTGLMGSSMGGLISYYGALAYPETFSRAGLFSPSYWFNSASLNLLREEGHREPMRIYQLYGGQEGPVMALGAEAVADTFEAYDFGPDEFLHRVNPQGQHNEALWAAEFEAAYRWLFADLLSSVAEPRRPEADDFRVFPNPASSRIQIQSRRPGQLLVYDSKGSLCLQRALPEGISSLSTLDWPAGVYWIRQVTEGQTAVRRLILR